MSCSTIELINAVDPSDFLGKAKEVLPDRILPSQEALEIQKENADLFMQAVKQEAVLKLIKEYSVQIKELSTRIQSIVTSAKSDLKKVKGYYEYIRTQPLNIQELIVDETIKPLLSTEADVCLSESISYSIDKLCCMNKSLLTQAKRIAEDGSFYPDQYDDLSAFIRAKALVRPTAFDYVEQYEGGIFIDCNIIGLYRVVWNEEHETNFLLEAKLNIEEKCRDISLDVSQWEAVEGILKERATYETFEKYIEGLEDYLSISQQYLKKSKEAAINTNVQSDLANLVRILNGLHDNSKNILNSLANLSDANASLLKVLAHLTDVLINASKG